MKQINTMHSASVVGEAQFLFQALSTINIMTKSFGKIDFQSLSWFCKPRTNLPPHRSTCMIRCNNYCIYWEYWNLCLNLCWNMKNEMYSTQEFKASVPKKIRVKCLCIQYLWQICIKLFFLLFIYVLYSSSIK